MKLIDVVKALLNDKDCQKSIKQQDILDTITLLVDPSVTKPHTLKKIWNVVDMALDNERVV